MKLLVVTLLCAAASPAAAYTTGVSGYSGKDGKTCTECHSPASTQAKATLTGPDTLAPGATATYTLVIDTDVTSSATAQATRQAGLDVATNGGTLGTVAQLNQTRLVGGELSHTNALPKAKTVQVMFTLTAPDQAGTVTLFAAALSADGDGSNSGDSTATTTLDVAVGGAPQDLAGIDAVSSATMVAPPGSPDLGPPHDELHWSCGSYVGRNPSADAAGAALVLLLPLLVVLRLRRRA